MEIIIGSIVGVALILLFIVIMHNRFQFAIIDMEEAENNIDILLHKKLELLNRTIPIVKKEIKLDSFLDNLVDKKDNSLNLFELNNLLKKESEEFFKVIDENT